MADEKSLPDGVPADNRSASAHPSADKTRSADYVAPDTATPSFQHPGQRAQPGGDPPTLEPPRRSFNGEGGPSQRPDMMSRERQNLVLLIAIVALAMALAAVFRIYNPGDQMQPCSELPEWNQYNCRAD
ncbi:MAG: hypothetical protein AAFW81_11000 [Pseudomonadota bacterium]